MRTRDAARSLAAGIGFALGLTTGCGGPRVGVPSTDPRYEFDVGRGEFRRGHWLEAQAHLKKFLDLNPGHARADSAQFLIGMSMFRTKSHAEAAVEFSILGREYPRSELRDDAGFFECMCYFEQMRPAQFDPTYATRSSSCFNELQLRFPDTEHRAAAETRLRDIQDRLAEKEFRLGVLFAKMKRPEAARIYLEGLVRDYPQSRWVPLALFWIGRSHEGQAQFAPAAESYRRLLEAFPDHEAARQAGERLRELAAEHPDLQSTSPAASPPDGPRAQQAPPGIDGAVRSRP